MKEKVTNMLALRFCPSLERGRFLRAHKGAAATEFALILPIASILMLGSSEVSRALTAARKIDMVANAIGQIVSRSPEISAADLQNARNVILLMFPDISKEAARQSSPWTEIVRPVVSSIVFTPMQPDCSQHCTYIGNVRWSWSQDASKRRPCAPNVAPAPATATPSNSTLPESFFAAPGSVIAVEVRYAYKPFFNIFGARSLTTAAYFRPRAASGVALVGPSDGALLVC